MSNLLLWSLIVLVVCSLLDKGGLASCLFKLLVLLAFGVLVHHLYLTTNLITVVTFIVGVLALINFGSEFTRG
jgi:hypothetical protein